MRKNLPYVIILILLSFLSCSNDEAPDLINLSFDWDCVAYTKYQPGEPIMFITGKPYWHLLRYSQGFTVQEGVFYHRYGREGESNSTDFGTFGTIDIVSNTELVFTLDSDVILTEIIEADENHLWLKYSEGGYFFEYKYLKN
jgi:hypothetical protein